ncbi:hypothetical protein JK386_02270 [Nocardioides sp. zg-536]|uniref:Sulfotransferase family protein n=1 Tax=Nocardioides faecalis TaxID=2803858 RepID=A0A938XYC5_9ACTN|nr:hypothetical protein [Nocardioides faecalis]MBM9458717.1 hypothetical protein [Nocardioides faecalis]MBS4753051.1 hypothetical protein [Nocardioides faecalis]QVI58704.1 hypothetical protein KG111_17365 [Nocardioides faecalis]
MSRRVLLHVGTPKTGTSYLQDVLFSNRELLLTHGISYPADRFDAHFLAALDLMRLRWGGLEMEAVGAWDRLAAQVREHDGTSIISHEILATASRTQVARALESLGHRADGTGAEVHLVISARDLVRQIPAEWQENVKHRESFRYARFLKLIADPERDSRVGAWFWAAQEVPDILARWGATIPAERIHVVTVPRPGGPPDLLWQRFQKAFGLTDIDLAAVTERTNPSLGVPESALVRRINKVASRDLAPASYRPLVRELLAHRTLSQRTDSPRLSLPPEAYPWVAELEEAWIAELAGKGYDVVGDLADLRGTPPDPARWVDPDKPPERQVASAAVDAIRALLLEAASRGREIDELREQLTEARAELDRLHTPRRVRAAEWTVDQLEARAGGRRLLEAYRRAKGSSSASA